MKSITVFTPTYNRMHLLPRLYESLKSQTCKDFVWLIIDDGSTDGSEDLVRCWKQENIIEIQYHYKENGGMHTGHNMAYKLITTELNVCIDSDDYMPKNAVDLILEKWEETDDKEAVSGLVALDADLTGKIIGSRLPENVTRGSYYDLYEKYRCLGDKKFILKTSEVKNFPLYPEFENERLVPLGILYIMMGDYKPFLFLNEVVCYVEYQEAGSSNTIIKQYAQSPRGFLYARNIGKKYNNKFLRNLIQSAHICSSAIFARDLGLILKGPKVYQNIIMLPIGVLLYLIIKIKIR